MEPRFRADSVILCTGTFLGGTLFRGEERLTGGRIDEASSNRLAEQLRDADLPLARLKTGTPPRLDGRTIDWAALVEQPSDDETWRMSAMTGMRCASSSQSADRLCHRPHQCAQPRYHPSQFGPVAHVRRGHRGGGAALLPIDRG